MSISKNSQNIQLDTKRHSFATPKKILFINNKGGVGKTSIAFNTASKLAQKGYKTCIVDLDPQCNTTMYAAGNNAEESEDLFNLEYKNRLPKTIFEIIRPQIEGSGDILYEEKPLLIKDNLYLVVGDLSMSLYEDSASNAYTQSLAGQILGFRIISVVERYLNSIGRDLEIDFFIIDTSPSLGMMNRLFLLGSDYFIVPVLSDAFSYQGIENLGITLKRWKNEWLSVKQIARANSIPVDLLLDGDPKCLGYVANKSKPYAKKQTKAQRNWAEKIDETAKFNLTPYTNKNTDNPIKIIELADYGTIINESQKSNKAIFEMTPQDTTQINIQGSKALYESANTQFEELADKIINRIENNY
jgi:cellulose biosynthesis protein BcsQ